MAVGRASVGRVFATWSGVKVRATLLGLVALASASACNSILGIGPPEASTDDAATVDAAVAIDASPADGGIDGSVDAAVDARPTDGGIDGGSGTLTLTGSVSSVGGGVTSATGLTLVNAGFENGTTVCAAAGGLCVTGGLTP